MHQWESTDGYAILQTGIVSAVIRSDLGTIRSMTLIIGDFLSSTYQESTNHFDRQRYRAVKNLLSGCMQNVATAPNTVAFHRSWDVDDPRCIQFLAEMLVRFHVRCWRELS